MSSEKYRLINIPETDSTNLQASALLSERADLVPFVVWSGYQRSGRGQGKNVWIAEKDKNLLCSIVVYPRFLDVSNHFYLSKITALALHDTLSHYLGNVEVKWPNDILMNDRKIAGILIENTLQDKDLLNSIVGIGININQTHFPSFSPEATSMLIETGSEYDVEKVLIQLLDQFDYWFGILTEKNWQLIDKQYIRALYRFNENANYRSEGYEFEARLVGVEADGHALLENKAMGLLRFGVKEVEFL